MNGLDWLALQAMAAADCLDRAGQIGVNIPADHDQHRLLVERAEQHTRLAQLPERVAQRITQIEALRDQEASR